MPATHRGEARALLDRAIAAQSALHSYSFTSAERLVVDGQPRDARVAGRAVLPGSLSYVLASGANHLEVVVLPTATYQRKPGRPWQRSAARQGPSPLDSLLVVLRGLVPSGPPKGGTVTGTLDEAQARVAGILGANTTAATSVTVDFDDAGRVSHLLVSCRGSSNGRPVVIEQDTTFSSFDAAAPITSPQ